MNIQTLQNYLKEFPRLKIGVIGDFALDFYYRLEKLTGEISIETGKEVHHGNSVRTYPGGAGNVVKNLRGLQVGTVLPIGMTGQDLFGRELKYLLQELGTETSFLLNFPETSTSLTYTKPYVEQREENRIDFGVGNFYPPEIVDQLLKELEKQLPELDALVMNQQFINPLITPEVLERLNDLILRYPDVLFIGDLRNFGHLLKGGILKLNVAEALRFSGKPEGREEDLETCTQLAGEIYRQTECKILLTRGASGLSFYDGNSFYHENGLYLDGQIDPVGAGDTCLSAFIAGMAAGMPVAEALELANLASAVTIKKVQETGTATPEEIMDLKQDCYASYNLWLASDLRQADYYAGTDIEVVENLPVNRQFRQVIFDHDGTISTLREGWEQVMLPVMVESICGGRTSELSVERYQAIHQQVSNFIDRSTGIQTIVQMQGLVEMIHREGLVPADQVKTAAEYKAIYLAALMQTVNQRINSFHRGERIMEDFTMKGAFAFLQKLAAKELKLYLASGTDEEDVVKEANLLGYGHFFRVGIFGSKGNEIGDAKKIVIRRILAETGTSGDSILVIGDGPVEIREGRRAGAYCIGVASDEVRRYGLNTSKRARLIRAGAHLVVPDFTHAQRLVELLFSGTTSITSAPASTI